MIRRQVIYDLLEAALTPDRLDVIDESHLHAGHMGARPEGETHFRVKITAAVFDGQSRLQRHRTINHLLAGPLREGVHALAIEARGTDEIAAR